MSKIDRISEALGIFDGADDPLVGIEISKSKKDFQDWVDKQEWKKEKTKQALHQAIKGVMPEEAPAEYEADPEIWLENRAYNDALTDVHTALDELFGGEK